MANRPTRPPSCRLARSHRPAVIVASTGHEALCPREAMLRRPRVHRPIIEPFVGPRSGRRGSGGSRSWLQGARSEARPRFLGPDSPGGPPGARRCRCYGDAFGAWSGPDVRRLKGPLIDGSGCRSGFPTSRSPTPIGGFGLSGAARIGAPLVGTPHLPRTRSAQGCRSARPNQLPPVWVSAREGAVRQRSRGSFRRADR